jgi:hypothetical protein
MDIPLPDRRKSIEARTLEGSRVRLQSSIAPRPYKCPGCHLPIAIGADHILVRYLDRDRYQHWHRDCVAQILTRELREPRSAPVEKGPSKGRRRAEADKRRRER